MKTKLLLLLIFLNLNFTFYSQVCGTETPQIYQKQSRTKGERGFDKTSMYQRTAKCLNVFYHIVTRNDGSEGFDVNQVDNITELLNQSFNRHEIYFNNSGVDIIQDTNLFNLTHNNNSETSLINASNNQNALNIYIVNSINNGTIAGFAFDIPNNNLAIINDRVLTSTLPHEVGHCFNLFHTHHGTWVCERDGSTCVEVDGINNETCGDEIEDTPADPGLLQFDNCSSPTTFWRLVDFNCNYTGNDNLNPDTTNMMSYSRQDCRDHFTDGQEIRMRDALFAFPVLRNIFSNSCELPLLTSNGNISCEDLSITFNLENAEPPINWTYSENLELIESTNTYITLKAIDNEDNGLSFVQANFGFDVELRETFWVGIPTEPRKFTAATMNFPDAPTNYYFELDKPTQGNSRQGVVLEREYDIKPTIMYNEGQNETETSVWLTTPSNIGIRLDYSYRYRNPCGWSVWSRVHGYTVDSGGGGWNMPEPFPNSSDESFKLDFRNKPPTTQFYIYLYDQYSNIKYQGESNNVEKTIDTMNLQNGVYYLHVYENGELKTKQIFVNH